MMKKIALAMLLIGCAIYMAEIAKGRFARIAAAKRCLTHFVSDYRYSFRPTDISRDQEDPEQQVPWRFEDHPRLPDQKNKTGELDKASLAVTVRLAANILGLGEAASLTEIRRAYRQLVLRCHPDHLPAGEGLQETPLFQDVQRAYEILTRYVESYRYSFRPEDIRRDQEGPADHHIRQFGRDPSWEL